MSLDVGEVPPAALTWAPMYIVFFSVDTAVLSASGISSSPPFLVLRFFAAAGAFVGASSGSGSALRLRAVADDPFVSGAGLPSL